MTTDAERTAPDGRIELNGINVIADADRKGTPRQLFWPWFGANVSVLALGYGSFVLGFGVSFGQALVAGLPPGPLVLIMGSISWTAARPGAGAWS